MGSCPVSRGRPAPQSVPNLQSAREIAASLAPAQPGAPLRARPPAGSGRSSTGSHPAVLACLGRGSISGRKTTPSRRPACSGVAFPVQSGPAEKPIGRTAGRDPPAVPSQRRTEPPPNPNFQTRLDLPATLGDPCAPILLRQRLESNKWWARPLRSRYAALAHPTCPLL